MSARNVRVIQGRRVTVTLILLTLLVVGGAGNRKQESHEVVRSDLDGVPLVVTQGSPQRQEALFDLESDLVLGVDFSEPEWQQFGALSAFLIGPDGQIVLADSRRHEVFIASSEGDLLARCGGHGSGPREFQELWSLFWVEAGHAFMAWDRQLVRMTTFDLQGELVGTLSYALGGPTPWRYLNVLPDGRFLASNRLAVQGDPTVTMRYWILDQELRLTGDLIDLETTAYSWPRPNRPRQMPFVRLAEAVPSGPKRVLSFDPYEGLLTFRDLQGNPLLHFRRDWGNRRLTANDRRSVTDPSGQPVPASEFEFPDRHPAFDQALADDKGNIWVERTAGPWPEDVREEYVYDIFDNTGVWIAIQRLPFRPSTDSDWIRGSCLYRVFRAEGGGLRFERLRMLTP